MKLEGGFYIPDDDTETYSAVLREWEEKGEKVLSYVKSKKACIQAGGNVGVFPIGLSHFFEEVYTFEPVKKNWECLIANIDTNIIHAENKALGAKAGRASISKVFEGNPGATQLQDSLGGDIEVITIDSIELESLGLIWLDVEGYEKHALVGASRHIEKFRPVIVIENKGLIPGFGGGLEGSQDFVRWVEKTFNYKKAARLMRDDVFVPVERV